MTTAGAQAALRGYRLQALYILFRLLESENGRIFQPEGREDLDVLGMDGELLEANQVKACDGNLTLSKFDLAKTDSFFRRVLRRHSISPSTIERVVSLGPIGPSMLRAWEGDGPEREVTVRYFKDAGYTEDEAKTVLSCVRLESVDRAAIEAAVFRRLRDSLVGIDPASAFDLLHHWIYVASEEKQRLGQAELHERIAAVGRFVGERSAHHGEWFQTIVPLTQEGFAVDDNSLRREFYSGISARYEHIQANVDVYRSLPLKAIDEAFRVCQLVVVHGASGQGKTALAYRYLHDFVPEAWRFEVRLIESRAHAFKISQALLGHLNAIGAPAYLYVDVSPGETHWLELVGMLSTYPLVRILVTIREEDWRRASSPRALVTMRDIELSFEKSEAHDIFGQLSAQIAPVHVLTFEDAWSRFGSTGPLLEFVHFIAQNETLSARLSAQVQRLRDEVRQGKLQPDELELLRRAAVATECGGRMDLAEAVSELNLNDPARTVDLFECEFLVRLAKNRKYVEGLHPIRSALLACLLTDDVFHPWATVATRTLPAIVDSDLEWFLLYALVRHPLDETTLRAAINGVIPKTWTAWVGVLHALLWLEVRDYMRQNEPLIRETRSLFGSAWWTILTADVGNVNAVARGLVQPMYEQFEWIPVERREEFALLRARLTPSHVLDNVTGQLLAKSNLFQAPLNEADWIALAEAAFWIGHLGLVSQMADAIPLDLLAGAVRELPLDVAADVAFGLSYLHTPQAGKALAEVSAFLIQRFQSETDTPTIEDSGVVARAHFLLDPSVIWSNGPASSPKYRRTNAIHDEAMRRVNLLRRIVPMREAFGCQGYGHNLDILPLNGDDSTKTGIPASTLPPPWPLHLNITLLRLADYAYRPQHWDAYAKEIVAKRTVMIGVLEMVTEAVAAYFRDTRHRDLVGRGLSSERWDGARRTMETSISFPKVAVDEWGQTTESGTSNGGYVGKTLSEFVPSLERHESYRKSWDAYSSPMLNFYQQATEALVTVPYFGRATSENQRQALRAKLQEHHDQVDSGWLSLTNLFDACEALPAFQVEFRERFAQYTSNPDLSALEERELTAIRRTFAVWHQFVASPRQVMAHAVAESEQRFRQSLDDVRRQLSVNLKKLRPSGILAKIRSESVNWEGKPSLWLAMDVTDPQNLFEAIMPVYEAIVGALQGLTPYSLAHCAVRQAWNTIHVLPFTHGRLIEVASWQMSSLCLAGQAEQDEEIPWWRVPLLPIPPRLLDNLNITAPDWPSLEIFDKALDQLRKLLVVMCSLKSVMEIPEPTGNGADILFRYTQSRFREIDILTTGIRSALADISRHLIVVREIEHDDATAPGISNVQRVLLDFEQLPHLNHNSVGQDEIALKIGNLRGETLTNALVGIQSVRLSWLTQLVSQGYSNSARG